MGDLGVKTVPVMLPTKTTSLATNTTLGTATEYSTTATVNMPETTRRIRHVEIQVTARDGQTAATDFDGARVGVQVNAVAFSDTDYTITAANSGDHTTFRIKSFPTSYFQTNDPGTATWTIGVRVRFQNAAISQVNNVTILALITYEYDSTAHASGGTQTDVNHVMIPIQALHNGTTITTTYTEIGTGGTAPAPANQIPQLTGSGDPFLPEASVSVKQYWLEVVGNETGIGTTDHVYTYRVDGATDNARHSCEQSLTSGAAYYDLFDLSTAAAAGGALDTTAAHAFEMKCDTTGNTMEMPGAVLHVVYTFDADASTTKVCNSIRVPLSNLTGGQHSLTDGVDRAFRYMASFHIMEPGPIAGRQSGIVFTGTSNNFGRSIAAAGQTFRTYTYLSATVRDSCSPIVHRCDHSLAVWSFMRGQNDLVVDMYNSVETDDMLAGGFAILNYHSGRSSQGVVAHNRTTVWPVFEYTERTYTDTATITPSQQPFIPLHTNTVNDVETEFDYTLSGAMLDVWGMSTGLNVHVGAGRVHGEGSGSGFNSLGRHFWLDSTEMGTKIAAFDVSRWWHRHGFGAVNGFSRGLHDREKIDITCPNRPWLFVNYTSGVTPGYSMSLWMTHHSHRFTLSGTYTVNGANVANGTEVDVFGYSTGTKEPKFLATVTTTTGAFSVTVYDDTLKYVAIGKDSTGPGSSPAGYIQRNGGNLEAPKVVARGPTDSSVGPLTQSYPPDPMRKDDLAIWFLQMKNGEDLTDPPGFVETPDSPQDATTCRLQAFYSYLTGDEWIDWGNYLKRLQSALSANADPGDHTISPGILIIRGAFVDPTYTNHPFDVTQGGTAASSTSVSIDGDTTTGDARLVLAAVANGTDTATLQGSAFANSNLVGLKQVASFNAIDGTGGGVDVAAGVMPSAGATGATTATLATASAQAKLMLAIKPRTYTTTTFNIAVNTSTGGGYSRGRVVNVGG